MIKVLLFAQLAEYAGCEQVDVEYEVGITPRSLVFSLRDKLPDQLVDALLHDVALVAANRKMIAWDDALNDGVELAFLPPFSGG